MNPARESGFTIVELMITLAVLAILVGIATPSFTALMNNSRLSGQTNEFSSDLALARSEAIVRGRPVTVCASGDGGNTCSGSAADWARGRIVFVERDGAGTLGVIDSTDVVLKKVTVTGNVAFTVVDSATTPNSLAFFTYRSSGSTGIAKSIMMVANGETSTTRLLCINGVGSLTLKKGASATC